MADFKKAFEIVMQHEGGYVNDKIDRGGETYKGIARKFHPNWTGWGIIDASKGSASFPENLYKLANLQEMVLEFYKKEFWDPNNLDQINDQAIANEMFDTGVNMGVKTASKFFQEALNLLNRNQLDFKDLVVDGEVGPTTMAAYNSLKYPKNLLKVLNGLQFMRYYKLATVDKTQEKFFNGWLNRIG